MEATTGMNSDGPSSVGKQTESEEDAVVPPTRLGRHDYVTSVVGPMVDQWVMVGTDQLKRIMSVVQKALDDITQALATGSPVSHLPLSCDPSPHRLTRKRPAGEEAYRIGE